MDYEKRWVDLLDAAKSRCGSNALGSKVVMVQIQARALPRGKVIYYRAKSIFYRE